jgi:zona occludens toxin
MAINAYCGLQGSGKSYEVTSSVIVPAIAAGRRVVTNIDGIDESAIHSHLRGKGKLRSSEPLGSVLVVDNDRISQPDFFPDKRTTGAKPVVEPGDLVVIDEAWRFWPSDGGKLSPEHMQFFRMHRHYTHPETGVACDVALIIQDISSLHRSVKNVVELSFRTTKLKSLGLSASYRLEMYEGYKQTRKSRIDVYVKRYRKEIFSLYRSYASDNGKEAAIDSRQNILKNPALWFWFVLLIALGGAGSWLIWRFFHPHAASPRLDASVKSLRCGLDVAGDAGGVRHSRTPFSTTWRIAGRINDADQSFVVLRDSSGRIRLEHASNFTGNGMTLSGRIDGELITPYTAAAGHP